MILIMGLFSYFLDTMKGFLVRRSAVQLAYIAYLTSGCRRYVYHQPWQFEIVRLAHGAMVAVH